MSIRVGPISPQGGDRVLFAELRATAIVPLAPHLLRWRDWGGRPMPATGQTDLSPAEPDTRADAIGASALPALDATWRAAVAAIPHIVLSSNGRDMIVWIDEPERPAQLRLAMEAIAAVARWDAALAATLAALPDATPLADAGLSPAAVLDPDGLRIGVRDGALVAELAVSGAPLTPPSSFDVAGPCTLEVTATLARIRWRDIEREPASLRAAIEGLRAIAARGDAGPYR